MHGQTVNHRHIVFLMKQLYCTLLDIYMCPWVTDHLYLIIYMYMYMYVQRFAMMLYLDKYEYQKCACIVTSLTQV